MQKFWAVLHLAAALAFAAAPLLTPDFGGFDPARYPVPQVDPPVQPAGYAFAIWGPIYLWLAVGAGFGLLRRAEAEDWAEMRPPLTLSLGIGATWLIVALQSPLAATVLIWAMLGAALVALLRAPLLDRWWARAPLGLYAGWLTAAACVALGLVLGGYGLMSERGAALAVLTLAVLIAGTVQIWLAGTPEYGAAVIWALIAVVIGNFGGSGRVALAALVGIAIMGLLSLRAASLPRP